MEDGDARDWDRWCVLKECEVELVPRARANDEKHLTIAQFELTFMTETLSIFF